MFWGSRPSGGKHALLPHCGADIVHRYAVGIPDDGAPRTEIGDDDKFRHPWKCCRFVFRIERKIPISCLMIEANRLAYWGEERQAE